jgi:hypothetical protein
MKKVLSIVAIVAFLSSCCGKQQPVGIALEKFFENPEAFAGKDTTFIGKIQDVCTASGKFILGVDGVTKSQVVVTPLAEVKVCKGCVGKEVLVKGIIKETVIDEEFIVALENESNAEECPEAKTCKQKQVGEYKELVAANGVFSVYSIEAKCVKAKDACCKDGEKKACCKDGEKKACCKDGEKKACCKDGEKKACCKDGEKKACCKDGEKKACCKDGDKKPHKHGEKEGHHHDKK